MTPIKKAYGYLTRVRDDKAQVLVFRHKDIPEAGIQVPKGTVKEDEDTYNVVVEKLKKKPGSKGLK
ncbi:hypothetical protein [Bacillus haikouensis]|uniref:hypothetical protein n=1 Tax=Bacillus haikouensis TaxID=1510468 RepID=UPI001FE80268|nr:hypothetical protein [Bacillus haikouensis]